VFGKYLVGGSRSGDGCPESAELEWQTRNLELLGWSEKESVSRDRFMAIFDAGF
jgi:hypothetical protein